MTHLVSRTHSITPTRLIKEIDRLVGPRGRSEFVTDAISEKLEREKRIRATREATRSRITALIEDGAVVELCDHYRRALQRSGCGETSQMGGMAVGTALLAYLA